MKIKSGKNTLKPKAILLSKRANIIFLERARVMQKDDRVLYLQEGNNDVDHFYNIPQQNTSLLLLGKGTSITDAAARQLADAGVVVGFTGTGGSPLISGIDPVFMAPQGEYRPTEYMQQWIRIWVDEQARLNAAKEMLGYRCAWTQKTWSSPELMRYKVEIPEADARKFMLSVSSARSTDELMAAEGVWARTLYGILARAMRVDSFVRQEKVRDKSPTVDKINEFLTHGNYVAYGIAAVALYALGISFALPVMHGKTRRGALVFDVADMFKDAIVMPLAFASATSGKTGQEFRDALIDRIHREDVLEDAIVNLQKIAAKFSMQNQQVG